MDILVPVCFGTPCLQGGWHPILDIVIVVRDVQVMENLFCLYFTAELLIRYFAYRTTALAFKDCLSSCRVCCDFGALELALHFPFT